MGLGCVEHIIVAEELTRSASTIGACLLLTGFYGVRCQTDANVRPAYRGLSLILVDTNTPGVIATDVGGKIAHFQATQLMGGYGFRPDHEVERF